MASASRSRTLALSPVPPTGAPSLYGRFSIQDYLGRVGTPDPNPSHGAGAGLLREAGVDVILAGEIRERAERLNFVFNHNMEKESPWLP